MLRSLAGARVTHVVLLAAALIMMPACSTPRDAIIVDEGMITIENQTDVEWKSVRIVVNDHFGGGAGSLAPGGRLNAPVSSLQTGFGQKFDRGRQSVFKVEVSATDANGKPVTLRWGADQQR